MARFFIPGNAWLLLAVILIYGRKVARTQPDMYSFFNVGGWLYPTTYNFWIGFCFAAAVACFVLTWLTWDGRPNHRLQLTGDARE